MKTTAEIRILVVEDDPFFQRVLQKRLSSEGYQVMAASDGREGMKAIVSFEPDVVLSDWMMPEVDGLELCQSVKTGLREAAPYFILLTAKGEISDKLLALETGADDYLVKPCDMGELMARVRAGLRIVLLTQDLRRTATDLRAANAALECARQDQPTELPGTLAICACCKQVPDGRGGWQGLDEYLSIHKHAQFSHGVCPECRAANYPANNGAGGERIA